MNIRIRRVQMAKQNALLQGVLHLRKRQVAEQEIVIGGQIS